MTLTSKAMPYKKGFGPFAPEVYRAPGPYPYRGISGADAIAGVKKLFKSQIDPSAVAAVIYEPVQGEGGFLPAPEGFPQALKALCEEHGILYIDDEVQAGMCRTGPAACIEHYGVEPDLCVWGKSMGGGMPIAGVTGRADLMDAVHVGGLGGTFGGNPISCVAAIESLDEVLDPAFQERSREARRRPAGAPRRHRHPHRRPSATCAGSARCWRSSSSRTASPRRRPPPSAGRTVELARERGLLLMGAGIYSNVIRFLVPIVATDADLDEGFEILEGALRDASA